MKFVKSIVALLLLLCISVGLCACGGDANEGLKTFSDAITATAPTQVEGSVEVATLFGPLTATFTATIAEDGSFTLNYAYDKFNDLATGGAGDVTSKQEGTVTYSNGTYSDTSLASKIPAEATAIKVKLDADKMTYVISNDGNLLTATVKAADTEAVLGVAYEGDVSLVLTQNEGKIVSVMLSYTIENAGNVKVVCNYK
jgi:hypothetical protein